MYGNILGTGRPKLPNYQTTQVQVVNVGGDNIRVTATYPYQPMIGPVLPTVSASDSGSHRASFNMQIAVTMRAIS